MPGVTVSAGYGAGGSVVAARVAQLLDVPLLDRAISSAVAAQLRVSVAEARDGAVHRSLPDRFLGVLAPLAVGVLAPSSSAAPRDLMASGDDAAWFREQAEAVMRAALSSGAVILGRAGAAAFRGEPGVLRVRLFGSAEARAAQAARIENVDEPTARRRLPEVDRARAQYVRRLYRADIDDPALFHLQIDSTVVPLEVCAGLIVTAYRDSFDRQRPPRPAGAAETAGPAGCASG
jgi:cytidylate kinase